MVGDDYAYVSSFDREIEREISRSEANGDLRLATMLERSWQKAQETGDTTLLDYVCQLEQAPVSPQEFLDGADFVAGTGQIDIWPSLRRLFSEITPDVLMGEDPINEVVLAGASGTGKTTAAWLNQAYQLYLLHCFESPQRALGLADMTPIIVTMQSLSYRITADIIYSPFRVLVTEMPWFQTHASWNKRQESKLLFESNVHVVPVLAQETSLQAQAPIGGILDEMSFMQRIEQSKQVPGPRGEGGEFDQAQLVHRNALSRRASRFSNSPLGCYFVMSNTRYKDDFMDRRLQEVQRGQHQHVFARRLKRYEMAPKDVEAVERGDTIRVFVGTEQQQPYMLEDDQEAPLGSRIEVVPAVYREQFIDDPGRALREVCGIATATITPFIPQRNLIAAMFRRGAQRGLVSWVDEQNVELAHRGLPVVLPDELPRDREHRPRWVHVDLSYTGDRCGIVMVKGLGLENLRLGEDGDDSAVVRRPIMEVELAVSIKPSVSSPIDFAEVRNWIIDLVYNYNFNIQSVTFDGFESKESQMMLRAAGIRSFEVSVDRTTEPYEYTREAIVRGRISSVENDLLAHELSNLEINKEKSKVDHPPKGSKDVADALAGATYTCGQSNLWRGDVGYLDASGTPVQTPDAGERPRSGRRPLRRRGRLKARMI